MGVYILDSNFFIQAYRYTYPLDVTLSFWNKVKQLASDGKIISIDKVRDEIFDRNDDLESWCRGNLPDNFFKDTSMILSEYQRVVAWAYSRNTHYYQEAINEFLAADEADAFLIAYALSDSESRILVTQEVSRPEMRRKIKIPEPCIFLKIRYIDMMAMFRELRETF